MARAGYSTLTPPSCNIASAAASPAPGWCTCHVRVRIFMHARKHSRTRARTESGGALRLRDAAEMLGQIDLSSYFIYLARI